MGGYNSMPPAVIGGGVGNNCGLVNECCGLADQGCCVGGQKCFTKYERVCRYQNQPVCQTQVQRKCVTHPIKYCRTISTPQFFNVPTFKCQKKRERKCWTYQRQECKQVTNTFIYNATWTEQEAVRMPERTEEKCYDVTSCKIVDDSQPMQQQVPQQKCDNVPQNRQVCRSVPVPSPPVERKNVVWETTYQQKCFNVPRTKCTTAGCNYGGCPNPAQTCAVGGFQTQSVCAQAVGPSICGTDNCQAGALCQQVETPLCQAGPAPCVAGPQQCCTQEMERVCQQIPTRVPRTVSVLEASPPQFKQVCDTVTEYKQECRTIMISTTVNVPTKRCETVNGKKCVNYKVPDVQVRESMKTESLRYPFSNCTIQEVDDQHCADLDTGVTCSMEQERRVVTIRRSVCDQEKQQQYCHDVPSSVCSNTGGQVCEMVPREVCQPTCPTTSSCNQCSEFVGGGGYSSCGTDSCSNFYPSSSYGLVADGGMLTGDDMLTGGGILSGGGIITDLTSPFYS